mgnify:CR=1 FL=1
MSILDKTKIGNSVQVNLELSKDRLTKDIIDAITISPVAKISDFRITDGKGIGVVLQLSNGKEQWFFEDEIDLLDENGNVIEKINFKKVINMGSIGCKIASIIRGESDIYISLSLPGKSSPKDWDLAAPEAILKAAGGAVTDINNKELNYGKSNYEKGGIIIASNSKNNHEGLCLQIKEVIRKHDIYPL